MSEWGASLALEWVALFGLALVVSLGLLYLSFVFPRASTPRLERLLLVGSFAPLLVATATWSGVVDAGTIRFERQWAAGLPTLASLFVLTRLRGDASQTVGRRVVRDIALVAATVLLGLGVAGLELGRPRDELAVVILVDESRSVELVAMTETRVARELAVAELSMGPADRIAVLSFGSNAQLAMPLRYREQPSLSQRASVGRDSTDIEQAIRQGLLELPPDSAGKLVLISDGVATRGDTFDSVAAALMAEVPVDVVALEQEPIKNVRLASLQGPGAVSDGEIFDLRAVVESPVAQELGLRILEDDVVVRNSRLRVGAGQEIVSLRQQASGSGLRRYEVQLTAQPEFDQLLTDNHRSAFVKIRGATRALILSKDPALNAPIQAAFEAAAISVTNVSFAQAPMSVSDLTGFDLVVLGDLPAHLFTPAQLGAFAAQVRALGGGLLLLGSDQSMGPGGYAKTTVEDVSPVSFDLKQDRRRGRLAQVIAIDYSGSMGAAAGVHTKLDLANEAAARSLSLLATGDRLGVMHVDTEVRWTLPVGEVGEKEQLSDVLRSVGPGGGGIYVDLALETAYQSLRNEKTNLKHVLLFADGSDAEERSGSVALARRALSQKVTTSVVALGRGADVPALEALSTAGAGRFYLIEDAKRLPAVFAQETILASRSSLNEETFSPLALSNSGPLRGVDFSNVPTLDGYVVTLPKPRAEVLIAGPDGDPILAAWSVGLGRAAAFTSDYSGRWSHRWMRWPGAPQLFAQLGRSLARGADDPNFRLSADARAGRIVIEADVLGTAGFEGGYRKLEVQVVGPDGLEHRLVLDATGPGRYGATMPLERPGAYVVSAHDLDTRSVLGVAGAELHPADELRPTGTDHGVLERIARETGGRVRASLDGLFERRAARRFSYRGLALELLWAGAAMLLLAVIARRLEPPDALLNYLGEVRNALVPRKGTPKKTPPSLAARLNERQLAHSTQQDPPQSTGPLQSPPPRARSGEQSRQPAPQTLAEQAAVTRPSSSRRTAAQILLERRRKRARKV